MVPSQRAGSNNYMNALLIPKSLYIYIEWNCVSNFNQHVHFNIERLYPKSCTFNIAPLSKELYIYIAPLSKELYIYKAPLSKSAVQFMPLIHTYHTPKAIGCYARYQPARQEQSGVRCLAQGHFDAPRVGLNRQPSDCQTTALTS